MTMIIRNTTTTKVIKTSVYELYAQGNVVGWLTLTVFFCIYNDEPAWPTQEVPCTIRSEVNVPTDLKYHRFWSMFNDRSLYPQPFYMLLLVFNVILKSTFNPECTVKHKHFFICPIFISYIFKVFLSSICRIFGQLRVFDGAVVFISLGRYVEKIWLLFVNATTLCKWPPSRSQFLMV